MGEVLSTIGFLVVFLSVFALGMCSGSNSGYKTGAIAVTKGELTCKEVEQLSKLAEWQCVEVVSE